MEYFAHYDSRFGEITDKNTTFCRIFVSKTSSYFYLIEKLPPFAERR
jgi:hypothetical protein